MGPLSETDVSHQRRRCRDRRRRRRRRRSTTTTSRRCSSTDPVRIVVEKATGIVPAQFEHQKDVRTARSSVGIRTAETSRSIVGRYRSTIIFIVNFNTLLSEEENKSKNEIQRM